MCHTAGILTFLYERLSKLLAGNDIKAIQKIIISLGHISFVERSVEHLNKALDLIFGLCRSKVSDIALLIDVVSHIFFILVQIGQLCYPMTAHV